MIIGKYKGQKVTVAQPLVRKDLMEEKLAVQYYEPNGNVVSRSGDVCVVSFCEQWYINYADENWKKRVLAFVEK